MEQDNCFVEEKELLNVALFQKTNYAFLFSGTASIPKARLSVLPPEIKYIIVHDAMQPNKNKLFKSQKETSKAAEPSIVQSHVPEKSLVLPSTIKGSQENTLAPKFDSRSATYFEYEDLLALNQEPSLLTENTPPLLPPSSSNSSSLSDFLFETGFETDLVKELEDLISLEKSSLQEDYTEDTNSLLRANCQLLTKLQELQELRFLDGKTADISETERNLESNLLKLSSSCKPKELIFDPCVIESAMSRVGSDYPVYGGTLPPQRPYPFASNASSSSSYPQTATIQKNF
ncbi:hypothetical protein BB560_003302 [Smittium megazygosporum]|uniref:Uncharacterized protein n=1 Tax=Smittium megazygosporum TaxID=133381 RepID=A0A2T9ZCI3_9FUNG|nr:hypothetical protein BB560_003302 [Smittium megazygosporum]